VNVVGFNGEILLSLVEKTFLAHAGILGIISFLLLAVGNMLGVYWNRQKKLGKRNRTVHGYFATGAYVLAMVHIGQGLTAYMNLQGQITGLAFVLHWLHIVLAVGFLAFFTKVLVDGYRGVMRCRQGHMILAWDAFLIILGYVVRNLAFGEIIYPFL